MATRPELKAEPRHMIGKKVRRLRRAGILPATVYGHEVRPQSIQLDARAFSDILRHAGRNQLIDLHIGAERARPVFIKQTAIDAKRHVIQHVEFYQANLREVMHSQIPIHYVGDSPAVKEGGIFLAVLDHLDVESLPDDVPPSGFEVDVSGLAAFNDQIHVSDVEVPAGVTVLTPGDEVLAKVNPPVSEAVVEEAVASTTPLPDELGGDQTPPDAVPES